MTDEIKINQNNTPESTLKQTNNQNLVEKKYLIISIVVGIIVIALIAGATYGLLTISGDKTSQIRDVFIIFMALESLIIGIALVVLIIQLATLINLLQNEIRPIIDSTNETVNNLKGTAQFLSNNLTEPVIKINQFAAMIKRLLKPTGK